MDLKTRKQCAVELIPAMIVRFKGKKDPRHSMYVPRDDGVVHEFVKFTMDKDLLPIGNTGGTVGPGIYNYAHPIEHKKDIAEFFHNAGIQVVEYE